MKRRGIQSRQPSLPPGVTDADLPGADDPPRCPDCDRLIAEPGDHVDDCEFDGYELDEIVGIVAERETDHPHDRKEP